MSKPIALVTGSDANYFHLLKDLLASVAASGTSIDYQTCIYDAGLTADQRDELEASGATVMTLDWCMDYPSRSRAPGHHRLRVCKPFMPDHFPGFDHYLWLDADLWVHDGAVLDIFARGARRGKLVIAAEYDRAYKHAYKRGKLFGWTHNHKHYRLGFGLKVADKYGKMPVLNGGAFSLPASSTLWGRWAKSLQEAVNKSDHPLMDQASMNLEIYRDFDNATVLPAYCHWLCGAADLWVDEDSAQLVEPFEPHQPIGLIHMAGEFEFDTEMTLKTVQGGVLKSRMDYRSWSETRDKIASKKAGA